MKKIAFLSLAVVLFSCQEEQGIDKLKSEKAELKKEYKELGDKIAAIDEKLQELDTTKAFTFVSAVEVTTAPFNHYFEVYGNVEADFNATVYPEAAGVVKRILVKEGQVVSKGQVLLELDNSLLLTQISEAQTGYDLAKTLYEKQQSLWKKNVGSEVDYLRAKNNKEAAESRLKTLREQVQKTKISAPFGGRVDAIYPKVGEMAMQQQPVIRIVNMDDVYVKADVAERYVQSVKAGTKAVVKIDVIDFEQELPIERVSDYINPDNRTFKVQINIDKPTKSLKPNMLASILIKDYKADSTVVLNNRLILQNPEGQDYVFVINKDDKGNSVVNKQLVTVGKSYDGKSEILEGLNAGQLLVDKGARSVKEGQSVTIAK